MGSWLRYAEQRVPTLYEEILRGNVKNADGAVTKQAVPIPPNCKRQRTVQTPTLFDYTRTNSDLTIMRD